MIDLEYLVWDSDFFGYQVGKLVLTHTVDSMELKKQLSLAKDFRLIYVFSDEILGNFEDIFHESKITFKKEITGSENIPESIEPIELNYSKLLELAFLSGKYSRFNLDKGFNNNEFKSLYKTWLDRSLNGEIAKKVVVEKRGNEVAGFGSVSVSADKISKVGLIAVDEQFQGKGIGASLLQKIEHIACQFGASQMEIDTQGINKVACFFYQKLGYDVKQVKHIYHFWNT